MISDLTMGVEEELLLLDADTLTLVSRADELLARAPADSLLKELALSQVEAVTPVCSSLAEVQGGGRARAAPSLPAAAVASDLSHRLVRPAAVGRLADEQLPRRVALFRDGSQLQGHLVREQLIAGSARARRRSPTPSVPSAVLDRIRDWLPILLALSASSPYWSGYRLRLRLVAGRALAPLAGQRAASALRQPLRRTTMRSRRSCPPAWSRASGRSIGMPAGRRASPPSRCASAMRCRPSRRWSPSPE